jgi:hypothetical protein
MKFGIFNNFGALNSAPVFDAFQRGINRLGHTAAPHGMSADVAVIWSTVWAGRMQPNHHVWQKFTDTQRPVIVLEVGMLSRGITWKMGLNGTGLGCYPVSELDPWRPTKLEIDLLPWQEQGNHILIAMQRTDSEQWAGMPAGDQWLQQTVDTVRQYTDRPVVVRNHPRQATKIPSGCQHWQPRSVAGTYDCFDFNTSIADAWAVINWNSGPGSQAVIAGVPAFVGADSLAAPVGNCDLAAIENPVRPDRSQWLLEVTHTEWTVDEIDSGWPIERLLVGFAQ